MLSVFFCTTLLFYWYLFIPGINNRFLFICFTLITIDRGYLILIMPALVILYNIIKKDYFTRFERFVAIRNVTIAIFKFKYNTHKNILFLKLIFFTTILRISIVFITLQKSHYAKLKNNNVQFYSVAK